MRGPGDWEPNRVVSHRVRILAAGAQTALGSTKHPRQQRRKRRGIREAASAQQLCGPAVRSSSSSSTTALAQLLQIGTAKQKVCLLSPMVLGVTGMSSYAAGAQNQRLQCKPIRECLRLRLLFVVAEQLSRLQNVVLLLHTAVVHSCKWCDIELCSACREGGCCLSCVF